MDNSKRIEIVTGRISPRKLSRKMIKRSWGGKKSPISKIYPFVESLSIVAKNTGLAGNGWALESICSTTVHVFLWPCRFGWHWNSISLERACLHKSSTLNPGGIDDPGHQMPMQFRSQCFYGLYKLLKFNFLYSTIHTQ